MQVDLGESEMHHIFEFFDRVPTHMGGSPSSGTGHATGNPKGPNKSHGGASPPLARAFAWQVWCLAC